MTLQEFRKLTKNADTAAELVMSVNDSELDCCRQADLDRIEICGDFTTPIIFLVSRVERCKECKQVQVSPKRPRAKDLVRRER